MKISLNWLQDFVDLKTKDPEEIRNVLTFHSAEVENIEKRGEILPRIFLAQIEKLEQHPNADKLKLATVNYGHAKKTVVCGGSNLKEGMKIAFADVGTIVLLGGEGGQMMELKPIKIRGVESAGMICASTEIGLGDMFPIKQEKEIVDLSFAKAPLGTTLDKIFNRHDTILDISNTAITHRADLFSHRGMAREFVANGLAEWKEKINSTDAKPCVSPNNNTPPPIEVSIDSSSLCSRYCAISLTGIRIMESPDWLKQRLMGVGIRPINNIVDITNYVMFEWGMPLHAFDQDQLQGKNHQMRLSKKGEKVITLDQQEHTLPEGVIVLRDENEIYDLCGIMGGHQSGIRPETNKIWLHAPAFNGGLVRKAARALSQHSDASTIFEKGVSNDVPLEALMRATQLILELSPGSQVASRITDIKNYAEKEIKINFRTKHLKRLLGITIPEKDVKKILTDLGFKAIKNNTGFTVSVPEWRQNSVTMEADLVEEVGRIFGYEKVGVMLPLREGEPYPKNPRRELQKQLKNGLVGQGFSELCTFSFVGAELIKKSGLSMNEEAIEVLNPISNDLGLMRQSLLPRILEIIAQNLRYRKEFRVFELSRTHHKKNNKVEEPLSFIVVSVNEDLRILQGTLETLLKNSGFQNIQFGNIITPVGKHQHPGRTAEIKVSGQKIAELYELHPRIAQNFDLKASVVIAEVNFEELMRLPGGHQKYQELDRFPAIVLDISLLVPRISKAGEYQKMIEKTNHDLIREVRVTDEYLGDKIPPDKRSLTFSVTYRLPDRTLTEGEVKPIHEKVLARLKESGVEIR